MFGVALRDTGLPLGDLTALARAADDAGYASIWTPEVGSRDAIALAALYGQSTRRATIGTGVIPLYSRNVASLSLSVATAAEACEGRFVLGLGAGHSFAAQAWFGAEWRRPRKRMRETVEVLRRVLSGERVSHDGEFKLAGLHLGSNPPAVPIYLAALSPASLRLAGDVADGVILNWLPPEGIEKAALLAREAAADAGRRVHVISYVRTIVVENPSDEHIARAALRDQTHSYLSLPNYANSARSAGLGREIDAMTSGNEPAVNTLVDALCAFGDASTVRKTLESYTDAGLDSVIAYPVGFGDDPAATLLHTIRALA